MIRLIIFQSNSFLSDFLNINLFNLKIQNILYLFIKDFLLFFYGILGTNNSLAQNTANQRLINVPNNPTNKNSNNTSNYSLDSHLYHQNQQYQQQYHFNNNNNNNFQQNKINQQLPPALLPHPPQPLLASTNFNKNDPKISASQLLVQQQRNVYPNNSQTLRQQASLNRPNSSNSNPSININSSINNQNGQRKSNQTFYNKSISKTGSVVSKSVASTNAVKPEVKSSVATAGGKVQMSSKETGQGVLGKPSQHKEENGTIVNLENAEELTQKN